MRVCVATNPFNFKIILFYSENLNNPVGAPQKTHNLFINNNNNNNNKYLKLSH
jgi:methyltransferase-like protein